MLEELYLKNSNLPKRYLEEISLHPDKNDYEVFEKLNKIKLDIFNFVKQGNNLLIYSHNCGNGKTTWATKIIKEYIHQVSEKNLGFANQCPALFINVTNFLNEKKLAIDNPEMKERINDLEKKILSAKLVVFDDLGVKNISQYDLGNLYYWIDERTNNMLSCIYTSNLVPDDLKENVDGRIYSRIVNYSIPIEIKDGDNRGGKKC